MKGKSSPSSVTPLQMLSPAESVNNKRELQIVATSPFRVPDDWFVELKLRGDSTTSPGRVDKYYHEPGTGRKFRSLRAVERYLTEGKQYTPTPETVKAGNENNMQIVVRTTIRSTSPFKLPDDWVIKEIPRSNAKYAGVVDKYYIEPGSGQRFRSLIAVERYLTQANENTATPKALKPGDQTSHYCGSQKKNISSDIDSLDVLSKDPVEAEEDTMTLEAWKRSNHSTPSKKAASQKKNISSKGVSTSASPPAKINWVLSGSGGLIWSAFMDESIVPESEKQKWSETFITALQDRNL